jgi:cysteine-rich repeat protein
MSKRAIYSIPLLSFALSSIGCGGAEEPLIVPVCGDGTLDTGEDCDDNNTINGDGCDSVCNIEPDALVGTFRVDTIYNVPIPISVHDDVNGYGTYCDVLHDANGLTFSANLTGTLTLTYTYSNCELNGVPDPSYDGVQVGIFDVVATAVIPNSSYTIVVEDFGVNLQCGLIGTALNCIDQFDDIWAFTAQ